MNGHHVPKIACTTFLSFISCLSLYGQSEDSIVKFTVIGDEHIRIEPGETVNIVVSAERIGFGSLQLEIEPELPPFASNWDSKRMVGESRFSLRDTLTLTPNADQCGSYTFVVVAISPDMRRRRAITLDVIPKIKPEPPFTGGLSNLICWKGCDALTQQLFFFPSLLMKSQTTNMAFQNDLLDCQTIENLSEGIRYGYFIEQTILSEGEFLSLRSDTVYSTQDNSPPPAIRIKDFSVSSVGEVTIRWPLIQDEISFIDKFIVFRDPNNFGAGAFAAIDTVPFFPFRNISPPNYLAAKADSGQSLYIDENVYITSVPDPIKGAALIRTARNDRWGEAEEFLTFELESPSYIYVAFDKRTKKPFWLERRFRTTRIPVETNTNPEGRLRLWKSREVLPAGKVTLGGNFAEVLRSPFDELDMYAVFVQPIDKVFPFASGEIISYTDPLGVDNDLETFHYRIDAVDAVGNVGVGQISSPIILDLNGRCKPLPKRWFVAQNEEGKRFSKGTANSVVVADPTTIAACVGFRDTDSLRFQAVRANVALFGTHRAQDVGQFFFDSGWTALDDLAVEFGYKFELLPTGEDPNFVNGQEYFYRVRSKDVHGNLSVWSDTVSAIQDFFPPSDISHLSASNRFFENAENGCIDLVWQPAHDPVSGVATYLIYRSDDSGMTFAQIDSVPSGQLTFCDSLANMTRNNFVHYKVSARDVAGNLRSITESKLEVTIRALVGPVIVPDSSQTTVCLSSILGTKRDTLTLELRNFDTKDVAGYAVEITGPTGSKTLKTINNLEGSHLDCPITGADGKYAIRVRAFYANGDTTIFSNTILIRKKLTLGSVQNLQAIQDPNSTGDIIVSWTHPDTFEVDEFQIFVWPEGQPQPEDPTIVLSGDIHLWKQTFDLNSLVAYQCNNYLVKARDCFGLISGDDAVVTQYSNRAPVFDITKTEVGETTVSVFWNRPTPRFKEDDSFDAEVIVFVDTIRANPDTTFSVFNKTHMEFEPQPMHNYFFQVRETILSDLGQSCSDAFVSAWSAPIVVPFKNLPNPVKLEVQPLPVLPNVPIGDIFVAWQRDLLKPAAEFLVQWTLVGPNVVSSSALVADVDTFLVSGLDILHSYDITVTAIDNLGQQSINNDTVRVAFNPRWQFTPRLEPIQPPCFRDSVTVKWNWVNDNLTPVDSTFGAESHVVELSIDPTFAFKKTTTTLNLRQSFTFHKETHYPFISNQNDVLYVRIRAQDRWNHISPWSTDYPELGAVSGAFDAIPPGIVTCSIESVKAPDFGDVGKVNVDLNWSDVGDDCSGTWYYEISRNDSIVARDTSRVSLHSFTDRNVNNDPSLLSTVWEVHAVDSVGNRQAMADACTIPFQLTPPDSGGCLDDTTFCWSEASASIPNLAISYLVEGARFPEFFGNTETDNVTSDPLDSRCFSFDRPWEQIYWRVKARVDGLESAWSDTFFCMLSPRSEAAVVEADEANLLPEEFQLQQNYPNPFNPSTTIRYAIPRSKENSMRIVIEIFNLTGQKIRALVEEERPPGMYLVAWDGRDDYGNLVGSGVYVYRMRVRDFVTSRKMIFLK